ncbi:hypothetical protein [Virgisporangium ochraceum]|nr:hypothetical protein [Virgisporangium ochraceum]
MPAVIHLVADLAVLNGLTIYDLQGDVVTRPGASARTDVSIPAR